MVRGILLQPRDQVISSTQEIKGTIQLGPVATTSGLTLRPRTLVAIPLAALVALGVHYGISRHETLPGPNSYYALLGVVLAASIFAAAAQVFWVRVRRWMQEMCPIIAAAVAFLGIWELITSGFHWLPLPYFLGPAAVLKSMIDDRGVLFDSTWHSLVLLLSGYALGVFIALITGVCIGWFAHARYWGMPLLKIIGPDSRHRLDSAGHGRFTVGHLVGGGIDRLVRLVPRDHVDRLRHFQYTRLPLTWPARWKWAGISHLSAWPGDAQHLHWPVYGLGDILPDFGGIDTVGVKSGLGWACGSGAGLGRIRQGLRGLDHHGRIFLHHHDRAFQSPRPRAGLAKGRDQVVTAPAPAAAAEASPFLRARDVSKSFPAPGESRCPHLGAGRRFPRR